ncbi:MAG: enoyl-CoA hydratase/isomerase family protein [Rhodobacteraceae bacterium]|nr:enoyl-CoA hydratase/isomerase family protein [Paracoccaceae bacterium]
MTDILIHKSGQIGHITLNRPKALNALTYQMCLDIEIALDDWANDDAVKMVLIDAAGEKAFCAGGDIQEMYDTAKAGDFDYGRRFWADEYRMNAKLANFPKPFVALMQGFTMGGGVGVSCHGSHRVVCETSQIAMPECSIGLVPDVGGSLLLARAPGFLGEYLGTTASRMDAGDAIYAGFADYYIPFSEWPVLTETLIETGDWEAIDRAGQPAPASKLKEMQPQIDHHFSAVDMLSFCNMLDGSDWCNKVEKTLRRNSPISVSCTMELIRRVRGFTRIEDALNMEYRFTYRSASDGDFAEGIRAAIIDKDRNPQWKHTSLEAVNLMQISKMLQPLGANALKL